MSDINIIAVISMGISFLFGFVIGRGITMSANTEKRISVEERAMLFKSVEDFMEKHHKEREEKIKTMGFHNIEQYHEWGNNRCKELLRDLGYSIHDEIPENKKNIKEVFCKNCVYWKTEHELSKLNKDRAMCSRWSDDQSYMFTQKYDFCSNFKKR